MADVRGLRGQSTLMKRLYRAWRSGEVAHAYFINGAQGSGKRTLARGFAQALVCTGGDKPCGACLPCRKVEAGNHPDIHWIRSDKASLGVEEIRSLLGKLNVRPYEAQRIVAVIEDADKLTAQAQNALLKALEEPLEPVVFLLLGRQAESFLPTILSRVVTLRLAPLPVSEVCGVLLEEGIGEDLARTSAQLSDGSVGRAMALARDDAYWQMRAEAMRMLAELIRQEGRNAPQVSKYLRENKKRFDDILIVWVWLLRDAVSIAAGAEAAMADTEAAIGAAARRHGAAFWSRLLTLAIKTRRMLASNVQAAAAADAMLIEMWEEFT